MSRLTRILLTGFELLVLFQVLDMLTTVIAIEGAGLVEGNSLPRLAMQEMGWWGLAMLKILSIVVGLLVFLVGVGVPYTRLYMQGMFLIMDSAGLVVVIHNSIAILLAIH